MSGNRKKYTPEYREQAVRLVVDTGRPIAHVAAEIGVGERLLGRWVAAAKARSAADNPEVLDDDERAELQRLRKENAELRLDRAFLKKPRPSSPPNRTGRDVPADRGGEGRVHGDPHDRTVGGVAVGVLQVARRSGRGPLAGPAAQ